MPGPPRRGARRRSDRAAAKPAGQRHHGDLRRALVLAGVELLEEEGVEALTIRALARRLGVSHAAPGHHFPEKVALLAAVAAEGFRRFGSALESAAGRAPAPAGRMKAIGIAYVRFALDHPATFRVMFGRELAGCREQPAELQEASAAAYAVLQRTSEEVAGAPGAELQAFAGWALVHGAAVLYLDGALRRGLPPGRAGRARFEQLVEAVMTPPRAARR